MFKYKIIMNEKEYIWILTLIHIFLFYETLLANID